MTSTLRLSSLLVVLTSLVLALSLYRDLPDRMPIHWNARGVADGFAPKHWGAFVGPFVLGGVLALFRVLPAISPRGFRMDGFRRVYDILTLVILSSLFVVTSAALLAASGRKLPIVEIAFASVGAVLLVVGNYLGKVKKNFFLGVRTPWTLASDEVWFRTHRLAGRLFVLTGAFVIVAALAGLGAVSVFIAILVASLLPAVYSFVIYRRLPPAQGSSQDGI